MNKCRKMLHKFSLKLGWVRNGDNVRGRIVLTWWCRGISECKINTVLALATTIEWSWLMQWETGHEAHIYEEWREPLLSNLLKRVLRLRRELSFWGFFHDFTTDSLVPCELGEKIEQTMQLWGIPVNLTRLVTNPNSHGILNFKAYKWYVWKLF